MRAILTYHSIDESGSPISLDRRAFERHVAFLARGAPRVVPLRDILAAPDDSVALTFDDGFVNFAEIGVPLLEAHGLPATVFVVADHVGGRNDWSGPRLPGSVIPELPLLSWDALGELAQRGFEIGAHTRRHSRLSQIPPSQLSDELEGCARRMHEELGERPESFAYPYGDLDHDVVGAARQTYSRGCTTDLRLLEREEDALLLPRLDIYYLRAAGALEQWGTPAFQRRLWLRAQARRVRRLVTAAASGGRSA